MQCENYLIGMLSCWNLKIVILSFNDFYFDVLQCMRDILCSFFEIFSDSRLRLDSSQV